MVPARSQHKLAVMGGLADYEGTLVAHAEKDQYHGCLFGGALPEGLEDSHEDDYESWPSVVVPARDKKVITEQVGKGKTFMWSVCPASQDVGLEVTFVPAVKGAASISLHSDKGWLFCPIRQKAASPLRLFPPRSCGEDFPQPRLLLLIRWSARGHAMPRVWNVQGVAYVPKMVTLANPVCRARRQPPEGQHEG